jgi:hypothetical protein
MGICRININAWIKIILKGFKKYHIYKWKHIVVLMRNTIFKFMEYVD